MRTGVAFYAADTASGMGPASAAPPSVAPAGGGPRSPWHSPVPYLFGGLAAMLGLIALALLILACSYWRVSSYLDPGADDADADPSGDPEKSGDAAAEKNPAFLEERFLVIMPGDCAPSVLAVPISICAPPAVPAASTDDGDGSKSGAEQGGGLSPPDNGSQGGGQEH